MPGNGLGRFMGEYQGNIFGSAGEDLTKPKGTDNGN